VQNAAAALEIPTPLIFVREDNFVPAVALGLGQPYALVVSSHWIELFSDDELAFVIGRELGHIAAGHTRFHSLLSVNGNENPLISLIFGGWLRRCALTCDKVGLLCCGSLDAAIGALGVATFHAFGRQVDYQAFAEQRAEIASDSVLRWGEWLSSEPYATQRIASMRRFITSRSYLDAQAWFVRERGEAPPALVIPGEATVAPRDCAGWWRRFAAAGIDAVVVIAIVTSFGGSIAPAARQAETNISVTPGDVTASAPGLGAITIQGKRHAAATGGSPSPPPSTKWRWENPAETVLGGDSLNRSVNAIFTFAGQAIRHLGFFFWYPVYLTLLVIFAGQTFGMMITGLRVVTTDFRKPSVGRTIWRYIIVFLVWWLIVALSFFWRRILLHDRLTKTRVVKVERVIARSTERVTGH